MPVRQEAPRTVLHDLVDRRSQTKQVNQENSQQLLSNSALYTLATSCTEVGIGGRTLVVWPGDLEENWP